MTIAEQIESKVREALKPSHLELHSESHMHAGPATESHFKLVVVADEFEGMSPVKRHRRLYQLLAEELAGPVHALAMHAYTPVEWEAAAAAAPPSPDCRGGSKPG